MKLKFPVARTNTPKTLQVKCIYKSDFIEKYEVRINGNFLLLRTNRPLLKLQGDNKMPVWQIDSVKNILSLPEFEETIHSIEQRILEIERA